MAIISINIMTIIFYLFLCIMTIMYYRKQKMGKFNQSEYINQYIKENYYTFKVQIPKDQKDNLKKHIESKGYKSLNSYVNDLIQKDMDSAGAGKQISIKDSTGVIIGDNGTINL